MVLGLKSKHKKGASVRVDYIIHIQEITPWPPSESLRSVQTVLLQWENGSQNSGSFLSVSGESNIVFNESFTLPVILFQDKNDSNKFKKNYLEFSLLEPRKDKAKGQLLGTAVINLADYGGIEDVLTVKSSINFKKSYGTSSLQPALVISFEPVEKGSSTSSPNAGLSNEPSLNNDDDYSDIASFTDDDASSHSSRAAGSSATASPSQKEKNAYGNVGIDPVKDQNRSSRPSSDQETSDSRNQVNNYVSSSKFSERSMTSVKNSVTHSIKSSPSSISFRDTNWRGNVDYNYHEININGKYKSSGKTKNLIEDNPYERFPPELSSADNYTKNVVKPPTHSSSQEKESQKEHDLRNEGFDDQIMEKYKLSEDTTKRPVTRRSDTIAAPNRRVPSVPLSGSIKPRLKHVKSVQIHTLVKGNESPDSGISKGEKEETNNELKARIENLEEELRESAAIELGLYSVVAEHSSSGNKVHLPARRLSRFYSNICREGSQGKRASAAKAAVSGLVLVSKACGMDVPRLTYWLSNSIMLRAIVSQIAAELPHFDKPKPKSNGSGQESKSFDDFEDVLTFIIALEKVESWLFSRIVESVWWQTFTPHMQPSIAKGSDNKTSGSNTKKSSAKRNRFANSDQENYSIELWKKAFKDACERLCPIRAGGHECGCLSLLVRLVMEQLVNRLDMSMFNAILRESADDMPTDPFSDPISDSKALPIPVGKSSFGAGAKLKNAIGNWSRWLMDLFELEDDLIEHADIAVNGNKPKSFKAFRLLHSLSDLMMLPFGMLGDAPTRKEVCPLFGPTIIKRVLNNFVPDEFCPDPMPRSIIDALDSEETSNVCDDSLAIFPCTASPAKYSPPPAALLSCVGEVGSQVLQSCRLSSLKKSYASDDELDELDSPLTSIIPDSFQSSSSLAKLSLTPKEKGGREVVRYQLLREIWKDDELYNNS